MKFFNLFRGGLTRFGVFACALAAENAEPAASDVQIIKRRLYDLYLRQTPKSEDLSDAVNRMQADGTYPGLDYDTKAKLFLPSFNHLEYVRDMAIAYRDPESPLHGDPAIREKILKGLDAWLEKDPQTAHNWFMMIGIPVELIKVLILMEEDLTAEQIARAAVMLKRGYRASDGACLFENRPAKGQNLIWVARVQLETGCLLGEYEHARRAAEAIAGEIRVTTAEGIQPDGSFHQHGPILYNGTYGAVFGTSTAQVAEVTRGTSLALSEEKKDLVVRYVLDSQQWMTRGGFWDFNVIARSIAFPGVSARKSTAGLDALMTVAPERADEISTYARRWRGEAAAREGVGAGNRMFWRSDYMVHQRPGYRVGIKMDSTRTVGTESGNGQGMKNYYMSHGAMSLLKTGAEYDRVYALWNWRQVPGITCVLSDEPYKEVTWGRGAEGTAAFAGGVSDGACGVAAYDFERDGVRARKAWFCFDGEIVCLGAGITSDSDHPVVTTIEQTWHRGGVISSLSSDPVTADKTEGLRGTRWLLHGAMGYVFPEEQNAFVQVEKRMASWHEIDRSRPPSLMESGEVFTAWIDHGERPKDATYAYVVVPEADAAKLAEYKPPRILANTPSLQAVWNEGQKLAEIVFYEPGSVNLPNGLCIETEKPCVLLAGEKDGSWQISVADPTQSESAITVKLIGPVSREIVFDLPSGAEAGRTVTNSVRPEKGSIYSRWLREERKNSIVESG